MLFRNWKKIAVFLNVYKLHNCGYTTLTLTGSVNFCLYSYWPEYGRYRSNSFYRFAEKSFLTCFCKIRKISGTAPILIHKMAFEIRRVVLRHSKLLFKVCEKVEWWTLKLFLGKKRWQKQYVYQDLIGFFHQHWYKFGNNCDSIIKIQLFHFKLPSWECNSDQSPKFYEFYEKKLIKIFSAILQNYLLTTSDP